MATTGNINNTLDPGAANRFTVEWCFSKLCKGDKSLEDEEQSDWPLEIDNNQLRTVYH